MALSQAKFRQTAERLFGKAQAGNLVKSITLKKAGVYDPATMTTGADITETVSDAIPEEYKSNQVDGNNIQSNDFKLLVRYESLSTINPKDDGVSVTVDGEAYELIDALNEFDILWTLQVRR